MRILDRYLVREIIPPFAIGLLVLTFALMMPPILKYGEDLVAKGASWTTIARVLWTLAPQSLSITIPMALLVGILVALGRLSADREFVALQACGVSVFRVLRPIAPYDRAAVREVLATLPRPGGGTAIGDAMREARPDLYRAGVFRKYVLVVTDGENTTGRSPDLVAREIWRKSEGAVQVYFVAFDTSPEAFGFLKEAGGDVIGAGTGDELRLALDGIYQGKILAEAPAAGERELAGK